MRERIRPLSRREVMKGAGAVVATAWLPTLTLEAQPPSQLITDDPGASIVALDEGVWAVISKPLGGASPTVSNGGVVVGRDRVLVFDGFARPEGASWGVDQIERQFGRQPTDVVVSHHHGDHVGGLGGFAEGTDAPPRVWVTQSIKDRVQPTARGAAGDLLEAATVLAATTPTTIDLGGRQVELTPMSGHTPSDVVGRLGDQVTFCGDLVWNDLFPNHMDAVPTQLRRTVTTVIGDGARVHVPGHGPLPTRERLRHYSEVIDLMEELGRRAFEAGTAPAAAAVELTELPESVGGWTLFSPRYFETAIAAWHRELNQ